MSEEIANLKNRITGAEGELLAIQAVIINVFDTMLERGLISRDVLEEAFSKADSIAEGTALNVGNQAHPVLTAQFLGVIEYLRKEILGE